MLNDRSLGRVQQLSNWCSTRRALFAICVAVMFWMHVL
jgi:hypothetical protein